MTTARETWRSGHAFILFLIVGACGGAPDTAKQPAVPDAPATATTPGTPSTLNTFINQSIEIDQLGSGVTPDDANLFTGPDPADGTASAQKPTGGPSTFIDWNDLGSSLANHKLDDTSTGKDPTSFPLSNECVGSSQVLSKMDLTYVGVANNNAYAYFAVQRANNNGDAGYYWLLTKRAPHLVDGQAPCKSGTSRLTYDISGPSASSGGDVLLAGHFHPNGSPLLRVFRATHDQAGVSAVNAVDFTSSLWSEDAAGVAAVAVNTTVTAPGTWGANGVIAMSGNNLGPELFAEAAIPISVFSTGPVCGQSFYGSVITRSSGSGGTSPDLKDLAGPALFNFGSASATATLTATCGLDVQYAVTSATGSDGNPIANPSCAWTFDTGATSSSCSGTISLPQGTHSASVTVSDPASPTCSASATTNQVTNRNPLAISIAPSATSVSCPVTSDAITYTATVTGGSGSSAIAWFGNPAVSCSGTTCTIDPPDSTFCASNTIYATATDTGCPAAQSATLTYTKTTTVTSTTSP